MLFIGAAHAVTIAQYATTVEDRVKAVHEKCSRFLDERRGYTTTQVRTGDARIQNFLISRDPSGSGLKEEEEKAYRRILGAHRTTTVADDIANLESKPHSRL